MSFKMSPIFPKQNQYLIMDWSNVVHRAIAVSTDETFIRHLIVMLAKYRKSYDSWEFIFALEGDGSAKRRLELATYKSNRVHTEETLEKISNSLELLNFIKCSQVRCQEGEADDAIASYIKQRANKNRVVIVTEDTDMWQLIDYNTTVKSSRVGTVTPEVCRQKQGVPPQSIVLKKALVGDKSDNIPKSVPRVGNKILTVVARKSKDTKGLGRLLVSGELDESLVKKIVDNKQAIIRNVKMIKLKDSLSIVEKTSEANLKGVRRFLSSLGVTDIDEKIMERAIGSTRSS